jgi:hypothetical protein
MSNSNAQLTGLYKTGHLEMPVEREGIRDFALAHDK